MEKKGKSKMQRSSGLLATILTFTTFALAALTMSSCSTIQQVHANLGTLNLSVESFIAGKVGASEFTLTDLANAKAIFDGHYAATGNEYDKANSSCMGALIVHYPALVTLFGPPVPVAQAAPVTGFFSGIAAARVHAEDTQASIAAKEAIIRNGFPPDVRIACAPWWLLHLGGGGATK